MARLRSVLWVGRAEGLGVHAVADTPAVDVAWVRDVDDALAMPLPAFDALVIDAGGVEGSLDTLRRLASQPGLPPVLVRVPAREATRADELKAAGATAVVPRAKDPTDEPRLPKLLEALTASSAEAFPSSRPDPQPPTLEEGSEHPDGLVANSAAMRGLLALVARAARSRATVLLTGETGTGKELLARAIHTQSARRDGPFIAVNCAAFPDTLLESELFGHARGAFTGADRPKKGLFELADQGTLFLDEVGETSPSLQAKLLRVLQEREIRPLGGARTRRVDARLVAATNRDLRAEVARGRLREDLYYRLAVLLIPVRPLRTRREDILPLAEHFLERHGVREEKPGCRLASETADLLLAHAWPGNVRELENEMQRALALVEPRETITPAHLSERLRGALEPVEAVGADGEKLRDTMARIEAWLIRRALGAHGGRRAATARTLGITREGLYKKMRRYGIE